YRFATPFLSSMKKAAIIPVKTLGDALILMIAANKLKKANFEVTILHEGIYSLKNWFSNFHFKKFSYKELDKYDHIFLQHDEKNQNLINELKNKTKSKLSIIYFRYVKSKHGPITDLDITLDENFSIAKSLSLKFQGILDTSILDTHILDASILDDSANTTVLDTGITIPEALIKNSYPKRVIIQPTSSDIKKCWTKSKFLKLAKKLKNKGFKVVFSVSPKERKDWLFVQDQHFDLPLFHNIETLAAYIYESAYLIGNDSFAIHLASLLNISHIMIASNKKLTKKWRPAWLKSNIILPPSWIPNLKGFRIREKSFQSFISIRKVFNAFKLTYLK
nr:hypothetical protein [Candidatus Anoxychlamydiales bacterium]